MKCRTVILLLVLVAILGCFAFAVAQEHASDTAAAEAIAESGRSGAANEAPGVAEILKQAEEEAKVKVVLKTAPETVGVAPAAEEAPGPIAEPVFAAAAKEAKIATEPVAKPAVQAVQETPKPPMPLPEQVDEKDVVVLDISNFDHLVGDAKEPWLVEFYAPWCGWCKKLAPVYAELATALKGKVHVGKVDATENMPLRKRFDIHGFPTIKFLFNGKMYDYHKERTVADFIKFVEGGYKEIENPSILPPPPPVWKQIQDKIYIMMLPMEKWVEYHIWPFTFITFGTGIALGMMFSMICCRPSAKPKSKTD